MTEPTILPMLIAESIRRAGPIMPQYSVQMRGPLEVEGALSSIPNLVEVFRRIVDECYEESRRVGKAGRNRLIEDLSSAINLIEQQLAWCAEVNSLWSFLRYVELGHVAFPVIIKILKQLDTRMSGDDAQHWLERRLRFGTVATGYLEDTRSPLQEDGAAIELLLKLKFWQAAMMVDYVALPMLTSAAADADSISKAVETLHEADRLLEEGTKSLIEHDVYYWRSKLYRHLAMARIKNHDCAPALVYLAISSLYGRQVHNMKLFSEITSELSRGYAEVHKVLGNSDLVHRFLKGTSYKESDIANYVSDNPDTSLQCERLHIHIFLIRHAERESDRNRRFGFIGDTTDRGRREFAYLGNTLKKALRNTDREVMTLHSSPQLRAEAEDLGRQLTRDQDESGSRPEVVVDKRLRPIDVGDFRGLSEIEAQNQHPGTYRKLQEFRLGYLDGYEVSFPNGESVTDFDRRITDVFCEILCAQIDHRPPGLEDIIPFLDARRLVFFGHTSTLTAILNMLQSLGQEKLEMGRYEFEPFETGSITEVRVDLARRARHGKGRRLPGGVEELV